MMMKKTNSAEDFEEPPYKRRRLDKFLETSEAECLEEFESSDRCWTSNKNGILLPKRMFVHLDDVVKFIVIYSTLLSMNNLIKILPNCILQIIEFDVSGTFPAKRRKRNNGNGNGSSFASHYISMLSLLWFFSSFFFFT